MLINFTVTVSGIASVGSHMTHWKCIHIILFSVGNVLIWFCYSEQNRLNYAHALVKLWWHCLCCVDNDEYYYCVSIVVS